MRDTAMEVQSVLAAAAADAGKLSLAAMPGKAAPRTSRSRLTASTCRASLEGICSCRLCEVEEFQVEEAEAEDDELVNEAAFGMCVEVTMGKSLQNCEIQGREKTSMVGREGSARCQAFGRLARRWRVVNAHDFARFLQWRDDVLFK
jgi:hypothetical protein